MKTNSKELYMQRLQRVKDAIALRTPDRVPFSPSFTYFPAKYGKILLKDVMYDMDTLESAIEKIVIDLQPDTCPDTFRLLSWALPLELLDYRQLVWPGHGLADDTPFQFVEKEYMKAEEYDDFLFDPTAFMLNEMLPRFNGALCGLKDFPSAPTSYYLRTLSFAAGFAQTEMAAAMEVLSKAGSEAQRIMKRGAAFSKKMADLGFPSEFVGASYAPYDYIGDFFRGTTGIMMDMYRCPDTLLEMLDKVYQILLRAVLKTPKKEGLNLIFIPLHKGLDGFMSLHHFNTFYWPTLKKMILALIDAGFTPCLLWEGNCDSRLEIIADIPKGKAVYWFERTDIFKAKEILGENVCVRGNIPPSLLNLGSAQEVKDYCKKLIALVGKGGGLIVDGAIGIPDEAKPENVLAVSESVREFGSYY